MIDPAQALPYEHVLELTLSRQQAQAGPISSEHKWRLGEDSIDEKEAEAEREKLILECMLLECGISFHSIFFGML